MRLRNIYVADGELDGLLDGLADGELDGVADGELERLLDGLADTEEDGDVDGDVEGDVDGDVDGDADGEVDASSLTSCVPISVSIWKMKRLSSFLRIMSVDATFVMTTFTGRSATGLSLYSVQNFSTIAKMILRISPVDASASAAVNSGNVASGTVMSCPFSDQFASQVVGVLSKAIA